MWITSRSTLNVKIIGQGHQVKKTLFQVLFDCFTCKVGGQGSHGSGQRSHGTGSKITWVKVSIKVKILAGGLTSASSCFISVQTFHR